MSPPTWLSRPSLTTPTASREAPDVRDNQPFLSASVSWFTAAALAACAGCGFSSRGGGNNQGPDASVDAPDVDASMPPNDGGSGLTCYGPAGWQACFTSPPTGSFNLPGTINTDNPGGKDPCLSMQPMGWSAPQPDACFIVRDTITVPGGGTMVDGSRPLVLVAKTKITVGGVLDVASHLGDTGTQPTECQPFIQDPNPPSTGNVGGGGGAGGSFMTQAGSGGHGDNSTQNGQASPADTTAPTHLRGGCPGQAGGATAPTDAGAVGLGGGSVYLLSGAAIVLQKSINASGAGGQGGNNRAGGSGGGSGGMIVLYSTTLTVSAGSVLMAHGGGGGGGSTGNKAPDGNDPSLALPLQPASGGGNGGDGYPATMNALDGGNVTRGGGGGGGGGGGAGYIRSNHMLTTAVVSPPAEIVP